MTNPHQRGPIFLGGAGRSGTTLLRVMLDCHRNICCGPELKILPELARWYQKLTGPYAEVMQSYGNAPADVARHVRGLVEGLAGNLLRGSGKPRWAEKTPHNVLWMAVLGEIFPDARFLHVLRDGRDVACSLVRMEWYNPATGRKVEYVENIPNAARYWREVVQAARGQAALPILAGRVLEVRYEDLVLQTEKTLRDVLAFLDEPWDEAVLTDHAGVASRAGRVESSTAQVSQPIYRTSIGRWQGEMTDADKAALRREAGALLVELGYAAAEW
jgi:protein-tyrosine sulfotransferase